MLFLKKKETDTGPQLFRVYYQAEGFQNQLDSLNVKARSEREARRAFLERYAYRRLFSVEKA